MSSQSSQVLRDEKSQESGLSSSKATLKESIIQTLFSITALGATYVISSYVRRYIIDLLEDKKGVSQQIARKLKRPELAKLNLNSYEARIGAFLSCIDKSNQNDINIRISSNSMWMNFLFQLDVF